MYTAEQINNLGLKDIHVGDLPSSMSTWVMGILIILIAVLVLFLLICQFGPSFKAMFRLVRAYFLSENFPCELSSILKESSLRIFPRDKIAALTGPDFFLLLDKTGHTSFNTKVKDWNELLYGNGVITRSEKTALLCSGLFWILVTSWRLPWSR